MTVQKQQFDKFYTSQATVSQLLEKLTLSDYTTIIEPSAGDGAFLRQLPVSTLAFDLIPERTSIKKANWLEPKDEFGRIRPALFIKDKLTEFAPGGVANSRVLVVGNPPFGKSNQLAFAFVKESAKFAKTIAFVMPKAFQKTSLIDRLPNNFKIRVNETVKDDSFNLQGTTIQVPSTILILDRLEQGLFRSKSQKQTPKLFSFVSRKNAGTLSKDGRLVLNKDAFDAMMVRVGGHAGHLLPYDHITATNFKYNYFIKLAHGHTVKELLASIDKKELQLRATADKTTGPRSLSQSEIASILNQDD